MSTKQSMRLCRPRTATTLTALVAAALLAACGGGAGKTAQTPAPASGVQANARRTAEAALASPAPCTAAPAAAMPPDASGISTAAGDLNGDGAPDQIVAYAPRSAARWHVRVTLADGYAFDEEIADSGTAVPARAIGGYDVDGDGTDEAFVAVGGAWGTDFIGLYHFDVRTCTLSRVTTAAGAPAMFPVGAATVAIGGLVCIKAGPAGRPAITHTSGSSSDGATYAGQSETFTLTGGRLSAGSAVPATFAGDAAKTAASLRCGDLVLR